MQIVIMGDFKSFWCNPPLLIEKAILFFMIFIGSKLQKEIQKIKQFKQEN